MTVEFEQEIFLRSKEERSSSNAWADASKRQMCPVPSASQGVDDSSNPMTNGIKNQGSLWTSYSGQWPDGGGKNVKNREF